MAATIKLDRGKPTTYKSALGTYSNVISKAAHHEAATELYELLWNQRQTIEALVRHHLRLSDQDACKVRPRDWWIHGSFNLCIPVEVRSIRGRKKLILRCPMPHKLAEEEYPGTVDEKLSSEVATYAWMQQHCPDVRIPHLYGFGFADHRHVSFTLRLLRSLC